MRLKARRGPKKAAVAVAASILTTAYHMLADGTCYQDLGVTILLVVTMLWQGKPSLTHKFEMSSMAECEKHAAEFQRRSGDKGRAVCVTYSIKASV